MEAVSLSPQVPLTDFSGLQVATTIVLEQNGHDLLHVQDSNENAKVHCNQFAQRFPEYAWGRGNMHLRRLTQPRCRIV